VEDRISGLENKVDIYWKTEESLGKKSRAAKGTHKKSVTPWKDQTCKTWALKKRCKPRGYVIYSTKL
jgi:hypothetical protein